MSGERSDYRLEFGGVPLVGMSESLTESVADSYPGLRCSPGVSRSLAAHHHDDSGTVYRFHNMPSPLDYCKQLAAQLPRWSGFGHIDNSIAPPGLR